MISLNSKKMRVLYLGDPSRPKDPWTEISLTPPAQFEIEFQGLLETHRYTDSHLYAPIRIILIDLDLIACTKPLDRWSINAWKFVAVPGVTIQRRLCKR